MIYSIIRILKYAFNSFFRNFWLSFATMLVIIILLFLINLIIGINHVKDSLLVTIDDKIDISLYLKPAVAEAEVIKLHSALDQDERIRDVSIITPEDGLANLRKRHPKIVDQILPSLDTNPLGYTIIIKGRELDDYDAILSSLEQNKDISQLLEDKDFNDLRNVTSNAALFSERINVSTIVLAGIFFLITIIIIYNSIRVSVYTHREEIGIMKLVGATNWFIRTPYIVESFIYSIVSITAIIGLLYILLNFIQPYIDTYVGDAAAINLLDFYSANFTMIFLSQLVFIIILNALSTMLALRRHLRV